MPPFVSDCFDNLGNLFLRHTIHGFFRCPWCHSALIFVQLGVCSQVHVWVKHLTVHVIQWELALASVLDNVQDRFGCSHLAYLCVLSIGNLPPFAMGVFFYSSYPSRGRLSRPQTTIEAPSS